MKRDEVMKGDGTKHDTAQRCDEGGYCSQGSQFHFFGDGRNIVVFKTPRTSRVGRSGMRKFSTFHLGHVNC
jgi:hypothetical protein